MLSLYTTTTTTATTATTTVAKTSHVKLTGLLQIHFDSATQTANDSNNNDDDR